MMEFDDPFGPSPLDQSSDTVQSRKVDNSTRVRMLLPLGLLAVTFLGTTLPWVVVRPFGGDRLRYNVTDVPGGMGIAWTLVAVAVPGLVILALGKRSGLVTTAVAAGVLGLMATISGLLLGVVTSLLPSLDIAGLDLTKAQVGQGIGVPITVIASLILGVMAVHHLSREVTRGDKIRISLLPLLLLVPLVLIGVNHHLEWLSLGSPDVGYGAELPGDALYGSGVLLVLIWFSVGACIISLVLQKKMVMFVSGLLAAVVGAVSAMYALLVWVGGRAVTWLLPDSVDRWTSVETQPALFVTLGSGIVSAVVALVGFFPQLSGRVIEADSTTSLAGRRVSWNSLIGTSLLIFCLAVTVVRIVK